MPTYRVDVIPGPRGGVLVLRHSEEDSGETFHYGRYAFFLPISQGVHRDSYTHDDAVEVAKMINSSSWIGRVNQ